MSMEAFLSLGFRPFYLGAALFAAMAIPLWIGAFLRGFNLPEGLPVYLWHTHEMLFGFAPAVIAGFLLTAARNWTGLPTASGHQLGALFGLWVLGRIAPFFCPVGISAVIDLAFLPALAVTLAIPLWRARNARNAFVIGILALLTVCNGWFHASALGITPPLHVRTATGIAMDVVLVLMSVIAGRIIPAFSANAIAGLQPVSSRWLEIPAIGGVVLITVADAISPWLTPVPDRVFAALLYGVAIAHLVRLAGWKPWRTAGNVLLFVLPLSYLWIPVHLLLRAWHGAGPGTLEPMSAHALLVGAMAGLMLSMMTRSALGHTGRPLRAGTAEVVCFVAIWLAALSRTFAVPLLPGHPDIVLVASAAFWTVAFATFAIAYAPRLLTARADGGI